MDILADRRQTWETFQFLLKGFPLPDPDRTLQSLHKTNAEYRKLLYDAHVFACVNSRKSGVLSLEGRLQGESAHADILNDWIERMDIQRVLRMALDAPLFGYQPFQLTWEVRDGFILPAAIYDEPFECFAFDDTGALRLLNMGGTFAEPLEPYRFLVVQNNPRSDNPYGEKAFATIFWPVKFKHATMGFWAIMAEKFGTPKFIGKTGANASTEKITGFLAMLTKLAGDGVAVISGDDTVEVLESKNLSTNGGGVYESLKDATNAEISKAILGQTLTTEVTGNGSYAASQTHGGVRDDIIEADSKLCEHFINTIIDWVYELNWPTERNRLRYKLIQLEGTDQNRADRDKKLYEIGVRFNKEYYQEIYGLTEDQFEITEVSSLSPIPPALASGGSAFNYPFDQLEVRQSCLTGVVGADAPVRPQLEVGLQNRPTGVGAYGIRPTTCPHCGATHTFAEPIDLPDDQRAIDALPEKFDLATQARRLLEPLVDAIRNQTDAAAIRRILAGFKLNTVELREALQHAIFLAKVWGNVSVLSELSTEVGADAIVRPSDVSLRGSKGRGGLPRPPASQSRTPNSEPLTPTLLLNAFDLPPRDALEYFAKKGLKLTWSWRDLWQQANNQAFTVAKVTSADLLNDVKTSLEDALAAGKTARMWAADITPELQKRGWWGKQETGSGETVTLGTPYRLNTIYRTNMQTSYMAGRYQQMTAVKKVFPFWQYIAVMDERTRPTHAILNGKIYPADDPFWQSFYPPNGFNCRCRVAALRPNQTPVVTGGWAILPDDKTGALLPDQPITAKNVADSSTGKLRAVDIPLNSRGDTVKSVGIDLGNGKFITPDPGWSFRPGR